MSSTIQQAFWQSFALFCISADTEIHGWRARGFMPGCVVLHLCVRVCVRYSILLSMFLGIAFPAYHAFCCQESGFDRNARVNYAYTLSYEEKKLVLFLSGILVVVSLTHTWSTFLLGSMCSQCSLV